jgi:hypothetical protein
MNGVCARHARSLGELLDVQVRSADGDRFVAGPDVAGTLVGVAKDHHGADPHLVSGSGNAHSDLASVGDEDLADGGQTAIMSLI